MTLLVDLDAHDDQARLHEEAAPMRFPPSADLGWSRRDIETEVVGGVHIVSQIDIGAISSFRETDLVAFHLLLASHPDLTGVRDFYRSIGEEDPEGRAERLLGRVERDGWLRSRRPSHDAATRLQQVYFTITRECDLACAYCYQGLRQRRSKVMPVEAARATLAKIAGFNPDCHVIVTGGEPFTHPDAFAILDSIEELGLPFGILCNGTYVDAAVAERLAGYVNLRRVQVSLDGLTPEVHALTRGRSNFGKAMAAIDHLAEVAIPTVVAPTIHRGNAHEIADLAVFAASKGAWFSPNNLRVFPHDENDGRFSLDNGTLADVIADMRRRLAAAYPRDRLLAIERRAKGPAVCSVSEPNANFICGTGHSLLDIDWNGEVYPCHLLKDRSLILGNAFEESFEQIFETCAVKRIRVPSSEIDKCGGCKFSSRCGGGCRAGAFYSYGSLAREDDLCDVNYAAQHRRAVLEGSTL